MMQKKTARTIPINPHISHEHDDFYRRGFRFATTFANPQTGVPFVDFIYVHKTKAEAEHALNTLEQMTYPVDRAFDEHEGTFAYAKELARQ